MISYSSGVTTAAASRLSFLRHGNGVLMPSRMALRAPLLLGAAALSVACLLWVSVLPRPGVALVFVIATVSPVLLYSLRRQRSLERLHDDLQHRLNVATAETEPRTASRA